jgi:hypothetical protein
MAMKTVDWSATGRLWCDPEEATKGGSESVGQGPLWLLVRTVCADGRDPRRFNIQMDDASGRTIGWYAIQEYGARPDLPAAE